MKIQTRVKIEELFIDGREYDLDDQQMADLEFSAIDTGGGFHDPILDVSFTLGVNQFQSLQNGKHTVALYLRDSNHEANSIRVEYEGFINKRDDLRIEGNGRLKGDQITKKLIAFVMRSFK